MTIEHKTTHGPHTVGQLAADWMLESGRIIADRGPRQEMADGVRLAVPDHDQDLSLESAAALRDALTEHLENMGSPTEALVKAPAPEALDALRAKLSGAPDVVQVINAPADVVKVAESIRDAYADNSRTIGPWEVTGMTEAEAYGVGELRTGANGCLVDAQGVLYTDAAARELRVKANRHAAKLESKLASPVTPGAANVYSRAVLGWTDEECRGAWNHAMEDTPRPGLLTDRPTGRQYTFLAATVLRDRLNEINGADAPRD